MIYRSLAAEIENEKRIEKLAAKLDGDTISKIATFHNYKSKNASVNDYTIAIPRGVIKQLVELAESAHYSNVDAYKSMTVGAAMLLRGYLPEQSKNKESSDDAKS